MVDLPPARKGKRREREQGRIEMNQCQRSSEEEKCICVMVRPSMKQKLQVAQFVQLETNQKGNVFKIAMWKGWLQICIAVSIYGPVLKCSPTKKWEDPIFLFLRPNMKAQP